MDEQELEESSNKRCCALGKHSQMVRKIVGEIVLPLKSRTNWICDSHRKQNELVIKVLYSKLNPHLVLFFLILRCCFFFEVILDLHCGFDVGWFHHFWLHYIYRSCDFLFKKLASFKIKSPSGFAFLYLEVFSPCRGKTRSTLWLWCRLIPSFLNVLSSFQTCVFLLSFSWN